MNRLSTATRGICSWRERLADPNKQWRRHYSAFEAAVSWELAARTPTGIPGPILALLNDAYGNANLLLAIAEHRVPLPAGNAASQNDVWGLVNTDAGMVFVSVEAKAQEAFGNETLGQWLEAGHNDRALANRNERWAYLRNQLPEAPGDAYLQVAYQLLHRCASAVVEARRFGLNNAACIVQQFGNNGGHFDQFAVFCEVMALEAERNSIQVAHVGGEASVDLAIGWADCPFATDQQFAAVA